MDTNSMSVLSLFFLPSFKLTVTSSTSKMEEGLAYRLLEQLPLMLCEKILFIVCLKIHQKIKVLFVNFYNLDCF